MGNSQTKHTIVRYGTTKKYSDTPSLRGVSKSATTGFLHERSLHLPDDLYIESEKNSTYQQTSNNHANFKRYSCFSFSACQPDRESLEKCESNQQELEDTIIAPDEEIIDHHAVKLRNSTSHRTLLKSTSGLFTKVCQRLVNLNRRSHPVNSTEISTFEQTKIAQNAAMPRSVTDSHVVHGINKFGGLGKSPAIQDLHGVNENPEMATKKISDLLEENEASYDEYENDMTYEDNYYENSNQLQLDTDNLRFQRRQFRPAQNSLGDSSSSYSEHSFEMFSTNFNNNNTSNSNRETACPLYDLVMNVNNNNNSQNMSNKATTSKNLETTSFDFIDEGRSEYIESIASSRSPSIRYSSYSHFSSCSVNNLNQLLCTNPACFEELINAKNTTRYSSSNLDDASEDKSESVQFLNQVNRRLVKITNVDQKYSKLSQQRDQTNLHSRSLSCDNNNNESGLDIGHIYQEQYNDNISIFQNRFDHQMPMRAPLASSETTTLSSSIDNLIDDNQIHHYKLFNPNKFPLINKLIFDHHRQMDVNNNNINTNVNF